MVHYKLNKRVELHHKVMTVAVVIANQRHSRDPNINITITIMAMALELYSKCKGFCYQDFKIKRS